MGKDLNVRLDSPEFKLVDDYGVSKHFIRLGFENVCEIMKLRVFDLLNLNRIDSIRAENMLLCIYRLLYSNEKLDEAIYNQQMAQYFIYREWKKNRKAEEVTVSDMLLADEINKSALLRVFDGMTSAFYKSAEYDPRHYKYDSAESVKEKLLGGEQK